MPFKPTDFTQVNHQINRVLVASALRLLDVKPEHRVADLFCGLGNFTLPLATLARDVVGIEGSTLLTERALENARANGLQDKTHFETRNLFEVTTEDLIALGKFDRMLIDPPRDGAMALAEALAGLKQTRPDLLPERIVYVSCSPSTLARDARHLDARGGLRAEKGGRDQYVPPYLARRIDGGVRVARAVNLLGIKRADLRRSAFSLVPSTSAANRDPPQGYEGNAGAPSWFAK